MSITEFYPETNVAIDETGEILPLERDTDGEILDFTDHRRWLVKAGIANTGLKMTLLENDPIDRLVDQGVATYSDLDVAAPQKKPEIDPAKKEQLRNLAAYEKELAICIDDLKLLDMDSQMVDAMTRKDRNIYALLVDFYIGQPSHLRNRQSVVTPEMPFDRHGKDTYGFTSVADIDQYKKHIKDFMSIVEGGSVAKACERALVKEARFEDRTSDRYRTARKAALAGEYFVDLSGKKPRLINRKQKQ